MAAPEAVAASPSETNGEHVDLGFDPPKGLLLPPPSMRERIEKVAGYTSRNGPLFKQKLGEKEANNPLFAFLKPDDHYHAYFNWRLSEVGEGRGIGEGALGGRNTPAVAPKAAPAGPPPPPDFQFSARQPRIKAQDMETMQLAALAVAKNGKPFQTTLYQREANNWHLDFLRSGHTLNQYFTRLVDQYTDLLNARIANKGKKQEDRIVELKRDSKNKFAVLERAKARAEYQKHQEKQKKQREEAEQKEKIEFAQIDWTFGVVETIVFDDRDNEEELGPPLMLGDLQSASLEQKAMMSMAPPSRRIEEAMPDAEYFATGGYAQQASSPTGQAMPHHSLPPRPQSQQSSGHFPPPPNLSSSISPAAAQAAYPPPSISPDPAAAARAAANAPMNIRKDYVPRAQAARRQQNMQICPNCKQAIPAEELSEHMRIELLDPRWKEQRAKNEARYATTNLSTADVANNLKRLASQRSDVFDGVNGEVISEEEAARRKRAATNYDGFIVGAGGDRSTGRGGGAHKNAQPNTSIEEQLRHIKEKNQR